MKSEGEKIAVIGAGLVGSLQAIYLARRGYEVHVYERRPDMRKARISAGRSINLALSDRGWKALNAAGAGDKVRETGTPMYGRMMHAVDGELTYQPYGREGQAIWSVSRGGLNCTLIDIAEGYENVSLHFDARCDDVNLESNELLFFNQRVEKHETVMADRIFGTDGAFSAIRNRLMKTDLFNYSQSYLSHGYKELLIPANADGTHKMEKNALHIWPRGQYMLIALANKDGSFTCTLFLPFEGSPSFGSISTQMDVMDFFTAQFPDAVPMMPTLAEDYFDNPTSSLVTIQCDPWNYKDRILMMGDASHAIVPFYGQGMNSGFEDCTVLNAIMNEASDWQTVFTRFSKERKPDADAICELALQNFIEMRDKVADPHFLLQKKIEAWFAEKHPDKWIPQYWRVTFSDRPYSEALTEGRKQELVMREIMAVRGIDKKWNSPEIEQKILNLL